MFGKKKKKTLIERLTGAIHLDEEDDFDTEENHPQTRGAIHHPGYQDHYQDQSYPPATQAHTRHMHFSHTPTQSIPEYEDSEHEDIGELSVDVINSADSIVVKAMIAGVKPADIDVDITRDSLTLKASRTNEHEIEEENFHIRELYWGTFARTISLPEEVDVDLAEAKEKHGLLIITLPKLDKHRKTKLQIKSN